MPRKKAAENCDIKPWLSRRIDHTERRYIQVGDTLLISVKDKDTGQELNRFVALSAGAKYLYLCMAMEAGRNRKFTFTKTAAAKYGIVHSSLIRNVKELLEAGMITRNSGKCTRQPNEYEFAFGWKPK